MAQTVRVVQPDPVIKVSHIGVARGAGGGGGVSNHAGLTGLAADDHTQYQLRTEIAVANGYASLDATAKVPTAQIPVIPQAGVSSLTADLALKAALASPAFTGTPTAPTATPNTNTAQVASTAFVIAQASSTAALATGSAAAGASKRYSPEDHVHPQTGLVTTSASDQTLTGKLVSSASTTARAGVNVPHGTAPTSPVNGDIWTTTTGVHARVNGATKRLDLTALSESTDVNTAGLANGKILVWDTTTSKWITASQSGGSGADPTRLNILNYGFVAGGTVDNSQAARDLYAAIKAAAGTSVYDSSLRSRVKVYIPAGEYRIVDAAALLGAGDSPTNIAATWGLLFYGDGLDVSTIVFDPTASNAALMSNQETVANTNKGWMGLQFQNMSFYSKWAGTDANAPYWIDSVSITSGASGSHPQNYKASNVIWRGVWNAGVYMHTIASGIVNTNSEGVYTDCAWKGKFVNGFLYGALAYSVGNGADQFLNYDFKNPNVIMVSGGKFVSMAGGGGIRAHGGQYILDNGVTVFEVLGESHASGAEALEISSARVEYRDAASKMIYSTWGRPIINVSHMDERCFVADNVTRYFFDYGSTGNLGGYNVTVTSCGLSGKHEYAYSGNGYLAKSNIKYTDCVGRYEMHNFITYTSNGINGAGHGGRPVVDFENWRAQAVVDDFGVSAMNFFTQDCSLGWQANFRGDPKPYRVTLKSSTANLPVHTSTPSSRPKVILPPNSVITGVRVFKKAAASPVATNTDWEYRLVQEGSPIALATPTNVSRAVTTGVVTVTTSPAHGFVTGDYVTMGGITNNSSSSSFNGTFQVTVDSSTQFRYTSAVTSAYTSAATTGTPYAYFTINVNNVERTVTTGAVTIGTSAPHRLVTGDCVTLQGITNSSTSPSFAGTRIVTVLDPTHFSYISTALTAVASQAATGTPLCVRNGPSVAVVNGTTPWDTVGVNGIVTGLSTPVVTWAERKLIACATNISQTVGINATTADLEGFFMVEYLA